MSATSGSPNRLHQLVDAVVYALSVTAVASLAALVLAVVLGNDVSAGFVKYTMFIGLIVLGVGTFKLRPSAAWKKERSSEVEGDVEIARTDTDRRGESIGQDERTPFETAVQRVPPLRWYSLPPDQRLSTGAKLFLAGLLVWAASLLTDVVFNGAFA